MQIKSRIKKISKKQKRSLNLKQFKIQKRNKSKHEDSFDIDTSKQLSEKKKTQVLKSKTEVIPINT